MKTLSIILIVAVALAILLGVVFRIRESRSLRVDTSQTAPNGTIPVGDDGRYQNGPNTP